MADSFNLLTAFVDLKINTEKLKAELNKASDVISKHFAKGVAAVGKGGKAGVKAALPFLADIPVVLQEIRRSFGVVRAGISQGVTSLRPELRASEIQFQRLLQAFRSARTEGEKLGAAKDLRNFGLKLTQAATKARSLVNELRAANKASTLAFIPDLGPVQRAISRQISVIRSAMDRGFAISPNVFRGLETQFERLKFNLKSAKITADQLAAAGAIRRFEGQLASATGRARQFLAALRATRKFQGFDPEAIVAGKAAGRGIAELRSAARRGRPGIKAQEVEALALRFEQLRRAMRVANDQASFDRAASEMRDFREEVDRAVKSVRDLATQERAALRLAQSFRAFTAAVSSASFALSQIGGRRVGQIAAIVRFTKPIERVLELLGLATPLASAFGLAIAGVGSVIGLAFQGLKLYGQLLLGIAKAALQVAASLAKMGLAAVAQGFRILLAPTIAVLNTFRQFLRILPFLITGFSVALARSLSNAAVEFDRIKRQFQFVFGAGGLLELEAFRRQSSRLGIAFEEVAGDFIKLAAAAQQSGIALSDIRDLSRATQQAAVVLGLSVEEVAGLFFAYTQVVSKGTLQSEEFIRQIGDRFPGAFGLFARSIGKTTSELKDLLKEGKITSQEFIVNFSTALSNAFGPASASAAASLSARLARLREQFKSIRREVADRLIPDVVGVIERLLARVRGPIIRALFNLADRISALFRQLESPTAIAAFREIGKFFSTIAPDVQKILSFWLRINVLISGSVLIALKELAERVLPRIAAITDKIQQTINEFAGFDLGSVRKITRFFTAISKEFDKLEPKFQEIFDNLLDIAKSAGRNLVEFFRQQIQTGNLLQVGRDLGTLFGSSFLFGVTTAIAAVADRLSQDWRFAWAQAILLVTRDVSQAAADASVGVFTDTLRQMNDGLTKMGDWAKFQFGVFKKETTTAAGNIKKLVGELSNIVSEQVRILTNWDNIFEAMDKLKRTPLEFGKSIAESSKSVSSFFDSSFKKSRFKSIIGGAFRGIMKGLVSSAEEAAGIINKAKEKEAALGVGIPIEEFRDFLSQKIQVQTNQKIADEAGRGADELAILNKKVDDLGRQLVGIFGKDRRPALGEVVV